MKANPEKAVIILEALRNGKSLRQSCQEASITHVSVLAWVEKDKEFNEAVIKAAKENEGAESGDKDKAEASEDEKAVSK